MISFALNLISGEKTYLSKSEEEVQILSLVLADEIKTNNLAPSGTIVFQLVDWTRILRWLNPYADEA
jgi:hypothetical protein